MTLQLVAHLLCACGQRYVGQRDWVMASFDDHCKTCPKAEVFTLRCWRVGEGPSSQVGGLGTGLPDKEVS